MWKPWTPSAKAQALPLGYGEDIRSDSFNSNGQKPNLGGPTPEESGLAVVPSNPKVAPSVPQLGLGTQDDFPVSVSRVFLFLSCPSATASLTSASFLGPRNPP